MKSCACETQRFERLLSLKADDRVTVTGQFMIERSDLSLDKQTGTVTEASRGVVWIQLDDEQACLKEWGNRIFIDAQERWDWGSTLPDVVGF